MAAAVTTENEDKDKQNSGDAKAAPMPAAQAVADDNAAQKKPAQAVAADKRALILPAVLLLLLLFIIAQWIRGAAHIPSDASLQKAGAYIVQNVQTDDAVAISPPWAMRGLQFLPGLKPVFDPQLALHPPEAARLWVLAEPEGRAQIEQLGEHHQLLQDKTFGRVQVALFDMGAQRSFHATDHLAEAHVQIDTKSAPVLCDQWKNNRWSCRGRPDWQHVGVEALDVDLAPRPIIWAHPPPAGETLRVQFTKVPLAAAVDVMAGNTVHGAQFGKAPISIDLYIDGKKLGSHSFSGYPLQRWRFDSKAWSGQTHSLTLALHTRDNGANHFAFDFVVVKAAQLDADNGNR